MSYSRETQPLSTCCTLALQTAPLRNAPRLMLLVPKQTWLLFASENWKMKTKYYIVWQIYQLSVENAVILLYCSINRVTSIRSRSKVKPICLTMIILVSHVPDRIQHLSIQNQMNIFAIYVAENKISKLNIKCSCIYMTNVEVFLIVIRVRV